MIKLKNKIIVFVVSAVLIVGSIVLINNKDIKVSSVSSSGKKYEVSYSQGVRNDKYDCNKWYAEYDNKVFNYNEVEEGYPLYIYNHCAVELDDYLSKADNDLKKTACDVQKSFVKKNYYFNEEKINDYNKNCYDSGINSERLSVSYEGKSCSEMKEDILNKFQENNNLYEIVYKNNCISSTGDIDKSKIKNYYSEPGKCESLKLVKGGNLYTGILKPNSSVYGSKNTCGYILFYVDGYSTGLDDYLSKVSDALKNEACSYKKDLAEKGYESDYEDYNENCADKVSGFTKMDPIEKVKIRFEARDGYGIDCPLNYGGADSTCEYSAIKGKSTTISLPEVRKTNDGKGLTQNGTGAKFSYWSTDSTCSDSSNRISRIRSTYSFNLTENVTYYACYETDQIVFYTDTNTEYGISCPEGYTAGNGICRYFAKAGDTITLPNVTTTDNGNGLVKNGNFKFKYWAKDGDCESGKRITQSNVPYTVESGDIGTFYACYDETAANGIDNYFNIHKTCNDANEYQATLTSTIKNTDDYSTNSLENNQSITKSNKTYTINKYCPMKCTETFEYTYPSIFETVKSGTYFELIYTPQVKSTYKCTQTFNYDLWKTSYNISIDNEKKAYVDYQNAEGINVINSPSDYGSEDSSCGVKRSWSCGTREHPKTCYEYYKRYNVSFTPQVYDISSKTYDNGTSVSATYCENDNISTAKSSLFNQIYQQLDTTKKLSEISADTDSTYVVEKGKRQNLQNMNKTCFNTLSTSSVSTEKFYSVKPNVSIKYDLDTTIDNEVKLITDDPYYSNDNLDRKDVTEEYNISYGSTNEKFNAYTFGDNHITTRTKKVNYEFHTNFDYYTNFYTGSIVETYNNKSIKLGNVFPVKIASSGTRNIKFVMDTNNSNLSGNVKNVLKNGDNATYTCTYKITNDAVVLDKETKDKTDEKDKKYKTTFFVRPIATNDVDPNNRLDKGLLGANWSSTKGQALMKIIEDKSKNQNTYNPNNLEYSFTLNANTLDQIREYNKLNKYDNVDWSTNCNGLGMECESMFLNGLSNGSLGTGLDVNGVNAKLTGRQNRKYYINGQWITLNKLTSYTGNECSSFKENESNYYDCLYRKVNGGVTP